jgi:nucleotide-binding universal stress UspA family protein
MPLGTILVLYDGLAAADSMLSLAWETAWRPRRIITLYVTRVPASLPLAPLPHWFDEDGQVALDRAEAIAHRRGFEVEPWLIRTRHPAKAILEVAHQCEVDAIFVPLLSWTRHPWRRLRSVITARALARTAFCPVLIGTWVQPRENGRGRQYEWEGLAASAD